MAVPGYPDGEVGAKVELLLGGTWTDITVRALPDGQQSGSINSGQPDGAQQPSPATMNAVWDNPDNSLSPRNASGPYFGQLRQNTPARVSVNSPYGGYLRLEADASDRAFVQDTASLHVTGSLELRIGVRLSDWRGGAVLAGRVDNTLPSWYLLLNDDGTLTFWWWDSGGASHSVTSPAAAAVTWDAFRVTLDSSDGNVQFFLSDSVDGTWTSMGGAESGTGGAVTSVQAGNAPLVVGWANSFAGSQTFGQVSGFRLYDGIAGDSVIADTGDDPVSDTAGSELLDTTAAALVADAAFSEQAPGVTTWTDAQGNAWNLAGGAEITARDYRLQGELASLAPTAHVSGGMRRLNAQIAGRLRRLQQGAAPSLQSPMRRAVLAQTGDLHPVGYWPMEDAAGAKIFGAAVGSAQMTESTGTVQAAGDSSFEASAPLPRLNGDGLSATVDAYTATGAWAVRFLYKQGTQLPAAGSSTDVVQVFAPGGAVEFLRFSVTSDGFIEFTGQQQDGTQIFTSVPGLVFPESAGPAWWSVEATVPESGGVEYALVALTPGATVGHIDSHVVTGRGTSPGAVSSVTVNGNRALGDSVFGHLSVQKAWVSLFSLAAPLNAWRTERTADRFARICAENSIPARIIGRPSSAQAMGPQPRGSLWTVLKDCANTEQSIIFEPHWACFGLGFRTRESMSIQAAGLTLSFAAANLPGDLQPVDDDSGFLNDVTGSMPTGETWRSVLDDGSAKSVSEPQDGGMGRYTGNVPYPLNVSAASDLPAAVGFYLKCVSADEPRYRNITGNLGVPGAPAAAMARLRPGDLIVITDVDEVYQSGDIRQLYTGATETFGPGRQIVWNGVPFSPYAPPAAADDTGAVLDTDGNGILDTDGNRIPGTGA